MKIKRGDKAITNCNHLKLSSSDGKFYKTDAETAKLLSRLIQFVESRGIQGRHRTCTPLKKCMPEPRGECDHLGGTFEDGIGNLDGNEIMLTTGAVMKHFFLWSIMVLLLSGCSSHVAVKDPNNLSTAEIIAVLQQEDIKSIETTHSQFIEINLKDGRKLSGRYCSKDAPVKYQDDILNVSQAIKKTRMNKWKTSCE